MAESVTIARPYAQAVFRLAREAKALALWSERLSRLSLISQDPEISQLIGDPRFSAQEISALFLSLSGDPECEELSALITLLAENERLQRLKEIHEAYEVLKSADDGVKEAHIVSAYPLDSAQLQNLMSELETHFGSRLCPHVEVDQDLIGGVRVAVGDAVLDLSVKGKIDAMAAALKN